jgi:hypothetical protein
METIYWEELAKHWIKKFDEKVAKKLADSLVRNKFRKICHLRYI